MAAEGSESDINASPDGKQKNGPEGESMAERELRLKAYRDNLKK